MDPIQWTEAPPNLTGTVKALTQANGAQPAFTTLVGGDFASPPAIGNTAPAAGNFTTLGATGLTNLDGGLAMDTNKFTVADGSGNTVIAGTLAVAGDVAINTNKFTVTASSGNALVAGTLAVTGAATFTAGAQSAAVALTATVDGLTTGTVAAGTSYGTITSSVNTKLITLPAPVVGNELRLFCATNGYNLQSSAPASIAINGGSGASTKLAVAAGDLLVLHCTSSTTWVGIKIGSTGTPASAGAAA